MSDICPFKFFEIDDCVAKERGRVTDLVTVASWKENELECFKSFCDSCSYDAF